MDYRLLKWGTKMIDVDLTGCSMPTCDLGIVTSLSVNHRRLSEVQAQSSRIGFTAKGSAQRFVQTDLAC